MPPRSRRTRQGGYVLLEMTIAMLVACLLVVWGAQALVNRHADAHAQSSAVWLDAIHKAVLAYVRQYGRDIRAAESSGALAEAGFADWRAPTLPELVQAGLLSAAVPHMHRLTGTATVSVWHQGDCSDGACAVEALVYGAQPLLDAARKGPDEAMLAQWLLAANGRGAAVQARDPGHLRGPAYSFSSTLPDGTALPVGTVGMAVIAEAAPTGTNGNDADFLRVGDTRDPDFQAGLSVAGDIQGGGSVSLAGELVIGAHRINGSECHTEGAVAHDVAGGLLVCRDDSWRGASRTVGGGYGFNSLYGCETMDGVSTANPVTHACSCPPHSVAIRILDTGPRPPPEGRQRAFLCVG